jgi:putative tricarboxylic transport membrane protein
MGALSNLMMGFSVALQPINLLYCLFGVLVGTLVGVLPGLGCTAAMALLLPITTGLPAATAIIMLAGIFYGAMYGGSTTAILLNIPGEPAAVVTALDGYKMARQGRAGPALGISAISSFITGTVSLFGLVLIAPPLADMALKFGPPEYFALLVLGLTIIVSLAGKSLIKGLLSGLLGLLLAAIGIDTQSGLGRFTFGSSALLGGVEFVAVLVGLFGISEVLINAEQPAAEVFKIKVKHVLPNFQELRDSVGAIWRSSLVGFLLGLLPGVTPSVTAVMAYDLEKRCSKHPELFGTGRIEGVAAAEGANNAATSGNMVPFFTLGLPTTTPMAVLLGALMIQGLFPGPMLFVQQKEFVWGVIASMYVGNVMLLLLNLPLIRLWISLLKVPYPLLGPGILAICFLGAYGMRNSMFDVWIMLGAGFLGYVMRKLDFPIIPLIISLILGDRMENAFRQSMAMSNGNMWIFLSRPIAVGLLTAAAVSLTLALYDRLRKKPVASAQADS